MPAQPRTTCLIAAWALVVVSALAALGLATASPAAAHGALVLSDPAQGGVTEALPSRAMLLFSDPVEQVVEITVTGPDGSVTNGEPTFVGPEVRQNLWAGPDGAYTMEYHVVAADGHEVRGEVRFEVGPVSTVGSAEPGEQDETGDPRSAEEGPGAVLPVALVLLAGVAALAITGGRRDRAGRSGRVRTDVVRER